MNKTAEILEHFGFTKIESEIYLAILALDKPSVTQIARKTGKNRTAVYFHLKNLLEKGIIRQTRDGRRFRFVAVPPQELAASFDQWTTDFKSLVPQLESLQRVEQDVPMIEVTESKAGYLKAYDEMSALPHGSEFRVMEGRGALRGEFSLLTQEEWNRFFTRMVDRKILTKILFTEEALTQTPPMKSLNKENTRLLRERLFDVRTLPEASLPIQHLMMIYGNKVSFFLPEAKLIVTLTHKGIVDTMRATFDALFTFAKHRPAPWG
ncbi:TrmB family transcriptional regulator [Candidatus Uhrbacteria bacterium]|nr:TrmB family transcriptional regulator [Candidatus Uhrbacteria bacterium]